MPLLLITFGLAFDSVRLTYLKQYLRGRTDLAVQMVITINYVCDGTAAKPCGAGSLTRSVDGVIFAANERFETVFLKIFAAKEFTFYVRSEAFVWAADRLGCERVALPFTLSRSSWKEIVVTACRARK
jgi:hypothetical protein